MAEPAKLPRWDVNNAQSTEPIEGIQLNGYPPQVPLAERALNWILQTIYLWIVYFRADINAGRDPNVGYLYASPSFFTVALWPGLGSGWAIVPVDPTAGAVAAWSTDADGPYVQSYDSTGASTILIHDMPDLNRKNDSVADDWQVLNTIKLKFERKAGSLVACTLERYPRAGGAVDVVHTMTLATNTAPTLRAETIDITIDRAYVYFFRITLSRPALGRAAAYSLDINCNESRVR